MYYWRLSFLFASLIGVPLSIAVAPPGPWDAFNFAPPSRTVHPKTIHSVRGLVQNAQQLVANIEGQATLNGNGSYVVLDFGQEVGGMLSLTINQAGHSSALSLAFTESSLFINPTLSDDSCRSVASLDADGVQPLSSPLRIGTFTQTVAQQRGGFRYLTVVSNSNAPVTISNISLHTTWMPHWDNLRAYTGYFFAQDLGFHDPNFLTRLWYAGAYTVQTNTIDSHQAREQPCQVSRPGWANDASGGPVEGPILVDGAKRDRTIWPGDMGISSHTELVALNDLLPSKNSLIVMFSTQDPVTGSLQYSGPPINAMGSDTYICWSLIGTHNYYLYTGDLDFVRTVWGNFTKALAFLESQVDFTGLMNVPLDFANDWGRDNGQGHNSAANAVLYRSLVVAADLATHLGHADLAAAYSVNATALKKVFNNVLWDDAVGMYRDSDISNLNPQDGNSLAVLFNVTNTHAQNQAISEGLTNFWTDIGPVSPELNDTIIPFVGGFEVQAHFIAGQGERALGLLHREVMWGYMLYTDISVKSSLLEGYTANGSLRYRATGGYNFDDSSISHSHGWATGPTPALTFFVLGLTITSAQGATWSVAPVLSGLDAAEGGFETGLGWFGVKWTNKKGVFTLTLEAPSGTRGSVTMPGTGTLQVDGKKTSSPSTVELHGGHHILIQRL
ncbi:glycoside hydrolase family 78 protein [Collybia nuda]|uniref:Glycoside hydrolase family 78 protein n=1 Tax=Collybia nuda TaxID=64659 RepID=A0A9P5Y2V1_9AGAR|nr:glycoside hydrolase family 78 protein [Collybia nuda]